jgi:hypothetical protein
MSKYNINAVGKTQAEVMKEVEKKRAEANLKLETGGLELLRDPAKPVFSIDTIVDEQRTFESPQSFEDAILKADKKIKDYKIRQWELTQTYNVSKKQLEVLEGTPSGAKKSPTAGPFENGELLSPAGLIGYLK